MSFSPYPDPVSRLLNAGDPRDQVEWPDYPQQYSLGRAHIPDLIRMAIDEDLNTANSESDEVWAPLHAWRTLGQLSAAEAVEPLLTLLHRIDDDGDDWVGEDLPVAIGLIGPAAIPFLADYVASDSNGLWARVGAIAGLVEISNHHSETSADCATAITRTLERYEENDNEVNAELVAALAELRQPETYTLVEQAYLAKKVDFGVGGDWEDFQMDVGLLDERITPEPDYGDFPTNFMADRAGVDQRKSHGKENKKVKSKRKQEKQSRKKNRKKKK